MAYKSVLKGLGMPTKSSAVMQVKSKSPLVGRTIVDVRPMTAFEENSEGWQTRHKATRVLVLDNGDKIYPSSDDEGNDAGTLFGMDKKGKTFYVM